MDFSQAFSTLLSAEKVARAVDSAVRNARGHKRAVLRELQENIHLLMIAREEKLPPEKVIPRLERKNYLYASDSGFNFKLLRRSALKSHATGGLPQFKKYIGWSTERLLENIYLKVKQVQVLVEIGKPAPQVNLEIRMEYLLRLMILFLKHIQES